MQPPQGLSKNSGNPQRDRSKTYLEIGTLLGLLLILSAATGGHELGLSLLQLLPSNQTETSTTSRHPLRPGQLTRSSHVLGMEVQDFHDARLGEVEELAVDLNSGRVLLVMLSSDGVLNIGKKGLTVPPGAFVFDEARKLLRLSEGKEKFRTAPKLDRKRWRDSLEPARLAEIYRSYNREADLRELGAAFEHRSRPGYEALHLSRLIGMPVRNLQEGKLGAVADLILDLPAGRIVQVIISSGGFLGVGNVLNVVSPSAFHHDESQGILRLDVTRQALLNAPPFQHPVLPDCSDPASERIYRTYHVGPNPTTQPLEPDNTALNVRDRITNALTPLKQSARQEEVRITRQIRREIIHQKGLSLNARNIKVITADGRVTLRGPVASEKEKQLLAELAARFAPNGEVDNQLEVTPQPP